MGWLLPFSACLQACRNTFRSQCRSNQAFVYSSQVILLLHFCCHQRNIVLMVNVCGDSHILYINGNNFLPVFVSSAFPFSAWGPPAVCYLQLWISVAEQIVWTSENHGARQSVSHLHCQHSHHQQKQERKAEEQIGFLESLKNCEVIVIAKGTVLAQRETGFSRVT